jgi:hypothetical protein
MTLAGNVPPERTSLRLMQHTRLKIVSGSAIELGIWASISISLQSMSQNRRYGSWAPFAFVIVVNATAEPWWIAN